MADPSSVPEASLRVDCPIPHRNRVPCWLCGSYWRNTITTWVLEQWHKAGRPIERPASGGVR